MATIRRHTASGNLQTDRGGVPNPRPDTAQARALAQFGGAIEGAATQLQRDQEKLDRTKASIGLQEQNLQSKILFDEEFQKITATGEGFSETVLNKHAEGKKAYIESLPPHLRDEYESRADLVTQSLAARSIQTQREQGQKYALDGLQKAHDRLRIIIDQNPGDYEKALEQGFAAIDEMGGILPPETVGKIKESWPQLATFAREMSQVRSDPNHREVYRSGNKLSYFASIRQAESGGDDSAKNPNSTATGRYQFTVGTWAGLMQRYPSSGLTRDGRSNPAQQETAIRLFTAENESVLTQNGIPASHGHLYAAHFLGVGAAVEVLKSPDNLRIQDIISPGAIKANAFLRSMTVADFRKWAHGKATGQASPQNVPSELSYGDYLKLQQEAQRQDAKDYDDYKGSYDLRIQTGEIETESQIIEDRILEDDDKATLLRSFRAANKDRAQIQSLLNAMNEEGGVQLNSFDAEHRRLGDKAYEQLLGEASEDEAGAITNRFIEATGHIPKRVVAGVRSGLSSGNPQQTAAALEMSQRIRDLAGPSLDAVDGGREIKDAAISYRSMVDRGMSAEEAAQKYIEMNSPEAVERRGQLKDQAKDFVEGLNVFEVTNAFDTFFTAEPGAGITPAQEAEIFADYRKFAEEAFFRAGGDPEIAKSIALEEMSRIYGVTRMNGLSQATVFGAGEARRVEAGPTLMKYPPENFYPEIGGSHSYLRDEIIDDAETLHGGPVSGVQLWPTRETSDDVRAGRPPRYILRYQDENGVWHQDNSQLFQMSPEGIQAAMDQDRASRIAESDRVRGVATGERQKARTLDQEAKDAGDLLRGRSFDLERDRAQAKEARVAEQDALRKRLPNMSVEDIQEHMQSHDITTYPLSLITSVRDRYRALMAKKTNRQKGAAFRRYDRELMQIMRSFGELEGQ